jgi:ribonuclease P protein component
MTVYVCGRESDRDPTRVGLAVSGGPRRAVARNRAKRRLRAAAAAALPRSGWDVVIRAQGDLDGISFQELRKALENVAPPSRQP